MSKISSIEYKKRNIAVWNEIAPRYHKRWASSETGPFESSKELVQLVNAKKGDKILDVACGTGTVTRKLYERVGDSGFVIGSDTSVSALKIAKRWNGKRPNLYFINADAEKFSFREKFDIVTCQYGLFFFPNAPRALRNMKNSLKNSGRLGISVHGHKDMVPFFASILDAVIKFIPDYVPPGTPSLDRYSTQKALRDEVHDVGFSDVTVKRYIFKYSPGDFEDYWKDYLRYVAIPIRKKLFALKRSQRIELKEMVKQNTIPYTDRNGTIEFPWEVLILTAKK